MIQKPLPCIDVGIVSGFRAVTVKAHAAGDAAAGGVVDFRARNAHPQDDRVDLYAPVRPQQGQRPDRIHAGFVDPRQCRMLRQRFLHDDVHFDPADGFPEQADGVSGLAGNVIHALSAVGIGGCLDEHGGTAPDQVIHGFPADRKPFGVEPDTVQPLQVRLRHRDAREQIVVVAFVVQKTGFLRVVEIRVDIDVVKVFGDVFPAEHAGFILQIIVIDGVDGLPGRIAVKQDRFLLFVFGQNVSACILSGPFGETLRRTGSAAVPEDLSYRIKTDHSFAVPFSFLSSIILP